MRIEPIDRGRLARTGQDYLELVLSDADWIVRSRDDLQQLRSMGYNPLAKLSEENFRTFADALEFKAGGVSGGYYKPLMSELALTEIFEVFETFGMSRGYALETHDSKCVGGTTCEFEFFSFCPSSVCEHIVKEV